MKRVLVILGIALQMAIGQAAQAATIPFGDSTIHWAGYAESAPYTWMNAVDAIGSPQYTGGLATTNGAFLAGVSFLDDPSYHAAVSFNKWLGVGDLFVDVNADSTWDYLVASNGLSFAPAQVDIFNITALGITTSPADTAAYINGYVRHNQPVALQDDLLVQLTALGHVGYSGFYDSALKSYSVKFDLDNYIDLNNNNFIIGFAADCGNEVILEQVPVPEPGTMVLLGIGMLGMAVYGKRRMNRNG